MSGPAKIVIAKCGGVGRVAEWLGLNRTSVLRWTHERSKGGTDGFVPAWHQAPLLAKAREAGVTLTPDDFFALPANDDTRPSSEAAA